MFAILTIHPYVRVLLCCARATVEEHMDNLQFMPTITITVANNDIDFLIR